MTSSISYSLLGMLALRTMTGYDVRKWLAETIGYFWTEDDKQIYPQLRSLAERGLVQVSASCHSGAGPRTAGTSNGEGNGQSAPLPEITDWDNAVYSLTSAGYAELARWLGEPPVAAVPRNEFLLKVFFGHYGNTEDIIRHIAEFHRRQVQTLELYSQAEQFMLFTHAKRPDLPYWAVTLDYGKRFTQMMKEWSEAALHTFEALPQAKTN
jgi:DNA-binding PadR family transcriptional regulator